MSYTGCFHCNEAIPADSDFSLLIEQQPRQFCCPGCLAVAETIIDQGLGDYYKFRTAPASKAQLVPDQLQLSNFDSAEVLADLTQHKENQTQIELSVTGISCAACAWLIEKQLQKNPAIHNVSVNSSTARCVVSWDVQQLKLSELLSLISKLGYQASPFIADQEEAAQQAELRRFLKRLAVSGFMSMQVMMLAFGLYFGDYTGIEPEFEGYLRWISLFLTTPVVFYSAKPFTLSAWRAIKGRELNMDVPVTLAVFYTFLASAYATVFDTGEVYFESVCMFVFLLQLGKFFEFRARTQARAATGNLLKIMPVSARLVQGDAVVPVSARRLEAGQVILVQPGETIAADGVVLSGQSSVDESMLTGEYKAVNKAQGDTVMAGSINHDGVLTVTVHQALAHSRLGQIIELQQQTLNQKPQIVEKTTQLARFFIQRLLIIALGTFLLWYFWLDKDRAFWVTLSVLVATCPCALTLATPTAITCALARLNRKGILIKNQQVLEIVPQLSSVFLDKTGSLTQGRFSIQRTQLYDQSYTPATLLALIARMEAYSEHPIARAFDSYLDSGIKLEQVRVHVGSGLSAVWVREHGSTAEVKVGSAAFCGAEAQTSAAVCCSINQQLVFCVELSDALRPEVPTLIQRLKQRGLRLSMLTGDSSAQVEDVQQQLQFDQVFKGCSPEQKVQHIRQDVAKGNKVLMLGDGINDSPCFHAAHVSVALDSGTDLSKNQADVVLLHNDLNLLQELIEGAALAQRIVKQNLWWAVGYNLVIIPLAVMGFVSPYIAVIGMSFSSILVVSNSLRLLKA
ncbi:cadmium-translocating P-type ATPase [Rheinheimera mesophila]|uniref:Cadmium-translocating P-type ATPase n=1 Tax=Rheinheimera mesophila TaxID=1547515 RepID=A0A3P3QNK5_9GAMM|nr:heavy metal translocating P-type ATPase [Rheinheimera mesophila]KKL01391.1 ATPase [Rheinheimera mesophila]RRJ22822.1 cadmium-translocating P-type ATPase [Rheinheimera mesophila]